MQFKDGSVQFSTSDPTDNRTYIAFSRDLGLYVLTRTVGAKIASHFSEFAANTLKTNIENTVHAHKDRSLGFLSKVLHSALLDVHQQLRTRLIELNRAATDLAGVAADILWLCEEQVLIGHVGTGRVYLLRSDKLHQLTTDQTLAMVLIKDSFLTESQTRNMPLGKNVANALGFDHDTIPIVISAPKLVDGDRFLLASSKLHRLLSKDQLIQLASEMKPIGSADSALVVSFKRISEPTFKPMVSPTTVLEKIQNSYTFRLLAYKDILKLQELAIERNYPPGTLLASQGEIPSTIWIGISGELEIIADHQRIGLRHAAGPFGESALFEAGVRSATVKAHTKVVALEFKKEQIMSLIGPTLNTPGVQIFKSIAIQEHYRSTTLTRDLAEERKKTAKLERELHQLKNLD